MTSKTEKKHLLQMHKMRLMHYREKGIGEYSDLSKNTKITPTLIKNALQTYIDAGGDEDFSDITTEKYESFMIEKDRDE